MIYMMFNNNYKKTVKSNNICPYCGHETNKLHKYSGLCPTCHNSLYSELVKETCRQCLRNISCVDCDLDIL